MTARPILFSAPMVRALLAGTKTQTRRLAFPRAEPPKEIIDFVQVATRADDGRPVFEMKDAHGKHVFIPARSGALTPQFSPKYAVGDRLWVRETWTARMDGGWTIADARRRLFNEEIIYATDGKDSIDGWWPSIHMPREFSRLTLTVTEVRVERLQDITGRDSIAEGVECDTCAAMKTSACRRLGCFASIAAYGDLWDSINGAGAFADNPWVSATTFTVEQRNIDSPTLAGAAA